MKEFYPVSQCDLKNVNQFALQLFKKRFINEEHIDYIVENHLNGISQHGGIYLYANLKLIAFETFFNLSGNSNFNIIKISI